MSPRIRFLLVAWLSALVGAAVEWSLVPNDRPWPLGTFLRTGGQLAALWSGAALFAGLLIVALRRAPNPASALLLGPAAWCVAWLLTELDPLGNRTVGFVACIGVMACTTAAVVWNWLDRHAARLRWLGSVPVLLAALVAVAITGGVRWHMSQVVTTGVAPPGAPNVLWISIDTLRADRVGAYGNPKGLTPTLDQIAQQGVTFEDATCPMPLTGPSHVAMLTGLAPHESGVRKNGIPLSRRVASLPGELTHEGYATAAFLSGFPLLDRSIHLASHFTCYDDAFGARGPLRAAVRHRPFGALLLRALRSRWHWHEPLERPGDVTVDRALEWLADRPAPQPFFVFLHLYDVHGAYLPHRPGLAPSRYYASATPAERLAILADPAERAHMEELYDGEVAFADAQVGRAIAWLRDRGQLDSTLVLVTADHGESLGEHVVYYEHVGPYHVETHVPLLLRLPKGEHAGTRVAGPAQLQDLPATLRDLLGLSIDLPGTSLAGAIGSGRIPRRLIYATSVFDSQSGACSVSARDGVYKLLRSSPAFERFSSRKVDAKEVLFDVAHDPGEVKDLLATGAAPEGLDLDAMRMALERFEEESATKGSDEVDDELAAELRKLGYVR